MTHALIAFDPARYAASLVNLSEGNVAAPAAYLRMTKAGKWLFGIEGTPVAATDTFIINPEGFQKGHICWKPIPPKSRETPEKLGEVMVGSREPLVKPANIPLRGEKWDFQLSMHLKGLTGAAEGKDMRYSATSVGGTREIERVSGLLGNYYLAHKDDAPKVPVVMLSAETYIHASFGEIHTPVITIMKWVPVSALRDAEPKEEAEVAPRKAIAKKKARR